MDDQLIIRQVLLPDEDLEFIEIYIGGKFIKFWAKQTIAGNIHETIYQITKVVESNII